MDPSGRFHVEQQIIGEGGYAHVRMGLDKASDNSATPIAIKLERTGKSSSRPPLERESRVIALLAGGQGIPSMRGYFRTVADASASKLIFCWLSKLSDEWSISIPEDLYRDLKPENPLMGAGEHDTTVYLIDFELSRRFRHPISLRHHPYDESKPFLGTARYASLNSHLGISQPRRDDLESVGYILIWFCAGRLPWDNLKSGSPRQYLNRLREKKKTYTAERLCAGLPQEFTRYMKYVRSLGFESDPDYDYIRSLFKAALPNGNRLDAKVDWGIERMLFRFNIAKHVHTRPPTPPEIPSPSQ